jgi:hypothetical protein
LVETLLGCSGKVPHACVLPITFAVSGYVSDGCCLSG